ncbi:MAG: ATP-binding cassette domain-containing protein, partial [Mangrovicoccus sp.]
GFTLRGQALLRDVSLSLWSGRCCAILGANGAGKSLTLRLLHGLLSPSQGQVLWQGRVLDRAARRQQSMMAQDPVMLRRSVRANLEFPLADRGLTRAERKRRVEEALTTARLTALANRPARCLSGGERARLALARALSTKPKLLLLDEPCASLDPASTFAVETMIAEARLAGTAILMVTHDAGQAQRLADDLVFLHRGQIAEAGLAAQCLDQPQSRAMQAWLAGEIYLSPAP